MAGRCNLIVFYFSVRSVPLCPLCLAFSGMPAERVWTLAVQLVKQGGIFFGEGCASQQLRAVAQRLRKRHFAAPATNLLVVAAREHLRHLPTAKLRGPGVVRIVQDTVTGELWLVTGMRPPLTPGLRSLVGRCQRMTGHR